MSLAFEDLQTGAVYRAEAPGAVLGRERARTDITFRDESISKRHARVFVDQTVWHLEDLDSSNGTFVRNERIFEPTAIREGVQFALAQRRFRVILVDEDGPGDTDRYATPSVWTLLRRAAVFHAQTLPRLALQPFRYVRRTIDQVASPGSGGGGRSAAELAVVGAVAGVLATFWAPALEALTRFSLHGGLRWPASLYSVPVGLAAGALLGGAIHAVSSPAIRALGGASNRAQRTQLGLNGLAWLALAGLPAAAFIFAAPLDPLLVRALALGWALWLGVGGLYAAFRWGRVLGLYRWVELAGLASGVMALALGAGLGLRLVLGEARVFEDGATELTRPGATKRSVASEPQLDGEGEDDTPFGRYAAGRAYIESTLDRHPQLLRDPEIRRAYELLLEREAEVDRSLVDPGRRDASWYEHRIRRRLRAARQFEATGASVRELADRLRAAVRTGDFGR